MKYRLLLMLTLWLATGSPCNAQETPKPDALSPEEIREGTLRIEQAIIGWQTEKLLREAMAKEQEFAERERQLAVRELEAERTKTALTEKDAVMAKERADFYEKAFTEATKGRSFGCKVAKIFTLGLARCR